MVKHLFVLILTLSSLVAHAQEEVLPPPTANDTLGKAPDYDAEMKIFDEFGYFHTTNALKASPVISLGYIKGFNLIYEKGGLGKKFSMNFLLGY